MEINDLLERYSEEREKQIRAIYGSIFILQNRLQTVFDKLDPYITAKQFMLLVILNQSPGENTFTHLGKLLGCSRQNVKKLAISLEKNGFVTIGQSERDKRSATINMTKKTLKYFDQVLEEHRKLLYQLFDDYTDEEINQLFYTLTKMYAGIDTFEMERG